MAFSLVCFACNDELLEPGGILLEPPDEDERATKHHLCVECCEVLVGALGESNPSKLGVIIAAARLALGLEKRHAT